MSNDQNPSPTDPAPYVTIIGETMRIQATMTGSGDVRMNGHLEGRMEVNGYLTIVAGGKADANVKACEVIVAGSAKGDPQNLIEEGACFKGGIETVRPPSSSRCHSA